MRWVPLRFIVLAAVLALAKFGFFKRKTPAGAQFAFFLVLLPGSFPVLADWAKIAFVPLPHRYQWEMDFAICLLITVLAAALFRKLPRTVKYITLAAALLLGAYQLRMYRRYASALIRPIDMTTTVEYKIADWLHRHYPGYRVFAIGTVAYWLNNFSDQPQASGGFEFGTPTPQDRMALKIISETGDAGTTLLWLRALGNDIAVVGGPHSQAPYRTFSHPERFDRFATKLWSDGDDAIYLIPRRSRSLAHVVRPGDTTELTRYVSALEDASLPAASFSWLTNDSAAVTANVPPGDVLSLQITYHPGWHAVVNGSPRPVRKDSLGFMTIDPACAGPCSMALTYDGGTEAAVMHWAAVAALCLFVGLSLMDIAGFIRGPAVP